MSVFLVLALVSQLVLWCVIAWSRVRLSVGYRLSNCVLDLPLFVINNNNNNFFNIFWNNNNMKEERKN